MTSDKPTVIVDGGVENFNSAVDQVVASRLLALTAAKRRILEIVCF